MFDRAVEHLDALDAAVIHWRENGADRVLEEISMDDFYALMPPGMPSAKTVPAHALAGRVVYREKFAIPANWAVIFTESIHAFYCSLDHLALALAKAAAQGPLNDQTVEDSAFPIFGVKTPSAAALKKRIGTIDPAAQAIIKGLQPCGSPDYQQDPLWVLYELDRISKHRVLPVVAAAAIGAAVGQGIVDPPYSIRSLICHVDPVEDGASILEFVVVPAEPGAKVEVEVHAPLDVTLEEGLPALGGAVDTLTAIREAIETRVFDRLEPFLS